MVVIHEHILKLVKEGLGEKGLKMCEEMFDNNVDNSIRSIIEEELKSKEPSEARLYVFKNRFQKTKRRWYKSVEDKVKKSEKEPIKGKPTELFSYLEFAESFISHFSQQEFENFYKVTTIEELKMNRLEEIKEWSENEEAKIIDYLYINDKTELQRKTALQTDIAMIALNIYETKFDGSINPYREIPDHLLSIPAFSPQKGKLDFSSEPLLIDGMEYYAQPYMLAEGMMFSTMVGKSDVDGGIVSDKELRLLDWTDEDIFDIVMGSRNNVDFMKSRSIYVNVREIMKKVYKSDSAKNHKAIVDRLNKMAHIKFNFKSMNEGSIIFGIYDNIQWDPKKETAIITINDIIQKQIIERQVTLMYRDVINKLDISMPKTVIFALQKERLRMHLEEGSTFSVFSYDFFKHRLQFKKKTKKTNIDIIKTYLNELQRVKDIILSYEISGDNFHVTFAPVMDYEVRDILISNQINPLEHKKEM